MQSPWISTEPVEHQSAAACLYDCGSLKQNVTDTVTSTAMSSRTVTRACDSWSNARYEDKKWNPSLNKVCCVCWTSEAILFCETNSQLTISQVRSVAFTTVISSLFTKIYKMGINFRHLNRGITLAYQTETDCVQGWVCKKNELVT